MSSITDDPREDENTSREIFLPEGEYVLECWKVKGGAVVRSGETVALACLASAKKDDAAAWNSSKVPQSPNTIHKRPSRRKRPTAPSTSNTNTSSLNDKSKREHLSSIKLPPAEKMKKESTETLVKDKESNLDAKPQQKSIPIAAPIAGFLRINDKFNGSKSIGFIEPCSHPTKMGGLCVVCGLPMPVKSATANQDNDPRELDAASRGGRGMLQITTENGLTLEISREEGIQLAKQNTERLQQLKKLSLVLDLDATLVHATGDARAQQHMDREDVRQIFLPGSEDGRGGHFPIQHFVKLRPNVKEFLEAVRPEYEIGVYTAGTRQYAEQIAIILCRHLVGAERDQIHLEHLRYQVAQAEKQLASCSENAPREGASEGDVETQPAVALKNDKNDQVQSNSTSSDAEPLKKKRRVVTFAVEPPSTKEDKSLDQPTITAEAVLELEAKLEEAEKKEKEAEELRRQLFGSRIVSRSDVGDLGRDVKSLRRIFPCGGTMAAVVDDREDVWANAKDNISGSGNVRRGEPPENLLLVEAYHWQPFTPFADINNASGMNLSTDSSAKAGDEEGDEQLLWTMNILNRLHSRYYSQDMDTGTLKTCPEILRDMRNEVLGGANIVLSGLIPLHRQTQLNDITRPRPDFIRYAESMGATILPTVQSDTSFVVAKTDGTDKTLAGRRQGCAVVKRSWLMQCYWSLTRRDPKPHLLPALGRDRERGTAFAGTPVVAARYREPTPANAAVGSSAQDDEDESDEDDDAFAAEFERDLM